VRFLLSASLRFALRASLRLFEIVPDDFISVFRLARHLPERFSTNGKGYRPIVTPRIPTGHTAAACEHCRGFHRRYPPDWTCAGELVNV
jgi:hypothetical protein